MKLEKCKRDPPPPDLPWLQALTLMMLSGIMSSASLILKPWPLEGLCVFCPTYIWEWSWNWDGP